MQLVSIILAGGNSTRMGEDKASLSFGDKSFLNQVVDTIEQVSDGEWVISSSHKQHLKYGNVIVDDEPNCGPLMGLNSCFKQVKADCYLVVSCDAPRVNQDLLEKLLRVSAEHKKSTVAESKGQTYPLVAVYWAKDLALLANRIEEKQLSVMAWLKQIDWIGVEVNASDIVNVNTPQEYENLMQNV